MSIIKHTYNRILEISDDYQQITLPNSRYYRRNGKYYPSITHVLSCFPKGKKYEEWLKNMGRSADYIVKKAAEDGTKVHEMVEQYLNGKPLNFLDKNNNPKYEPEIWKMFLKFVEFWETYNPKLIETEVHLFSDELEVAGTCDLICEIEGKTWLIDLKTSNMMHETYPIQTSVYGQCYKECYGVDIENYGILWLKSTKRKLNKEKMSGKGWEMVLPERSQEENLEIFKTVKTLFHLIYPNDIPEFTTFKTNVKRNLQ
jgi:siroheme synthase (precorrin-2 oxidase/ferrochelatase)